MKEAITTIGTKLTSVNDQFTVNMYDNGFMFEISGRDDDDEYQTVKILCNTVDEITALIDEAADMQRDI
jgi:hypothetical protein|tara:strand:- start:374 stop:580 length:207 start_codon:yes stop_codon:yes gene_type:complete